jgi:cob(I)alamin adenosyltransferase
MTEKVQQTPSYAELNEINRRIRMIEIKMNKIEEMILSVEKSIQQFEMDLKIMKDINEKKVNDLKKEISLLNENIEAINKKTEQFVNKSEIQKIKTFLEIFNPLTSKFVSREELEVEIEELKKNILKKENKI